MKTPDRKLAKVKNWQKNTAIGRATVKKANDKLRDQIKSELEPHSSLFRVNRKAHKFGVHAWPSRSYKMNGVNIYGR